MFIKAMVQAVRDGPHGRFVVATAEGYEGSITFSLERSVWQEAEYPEPGILVELSNLVQKRRGWRALFGRYYRQTSTPAISNRKALKMTEQTTTKVDEILSPLEQFSTQVHGTEDNPSIGGLFTSDQNHPTITHAEFIKRKVLPRLHAAVERFGAERVAEELVEVALPAYKKIHPDHMACFWNVTITGIHDGSREEQEEHRRRNAGQLNYELAAEIGVKEIYSPIIDLALAHQDTQVFTVSKFFVTHACRMGYVIRTFSYNNWLTYIYLAKKLLRHGVYDWSVERTPEEWEELKPAIEKYGFRATLNPFVDMMAALGHVQGANEYKYKYSMLRSTLRGMSPYIVERIMDEGPETTRRIVQPIVDYVDEMHERGAFQFGSTIGDEGDFFRSFKEYLPFIKEKGTAQVVEAVSVHWTPKLLNSNK